MEYFKTEKWNIDKFRSAYLTIGILGEWATS